jgi:hypothetical protein
LGWAFYSWKTVFSWQVASGWIRKADTLVITENDLLPIGKDRNFSAMFKTKCFDLFFGIWCPTQRNGGAARWKKQQGLVTFNQFAHEKKNLDVFVPVNFFSFKA